MGLDDEGIRGAVSGTFVGEPGKWVVELGGWVADVGRSLGCRGASYVETDASIRFRGIGLYQVGT
jgi:hypothetical protein